MKKIIIGIIFCTLLVWCSQKAEVPNENSEINVETTQVKQGLETQEEVKWEEQEIEEEKTHAKEIRKHSDGNIYLYEEGLEIDYLTSKAKICPEWEFCDSEIWYDILEGNETYWIVKKVEKKWECSETTFYAIDFFTDERILTEITSEGLCFQSYEGSISKDDFIISIEYPESVVTQVIDKWEISQSSVESEGFKKQWDNWVKTFNLSEIFSSIDETENIVSDHEILVARGFEVNNLWDITEYYKKDGTGQWGTSYQTIYRKGDKEINLSVFYKYAIWETTISDGEWNSTTLNHDAEIELSGLDLYGSIQPIFKEEWFSGKYIVDESLDTIRLVNTEKNINEVIWTRK